MSLVGIKFPTFFRTPARGGVLEVQEFKVGLGPCGKTVNTLSFSRIAVGMACFIEITQWHSDDTYKTFQYPLDQIIGRIELFYE